jgi:hypothetical protein
MKAEDAKDWATVYRLKVEGLNGESWLRASSRLAEVLLQEELTPRRREKILGWLFDYDAEMCRWTHYETEMTDDRIYRVLIDPETYRVSVVCFGLDALDPRVEGEYDSVDALPAWVQERLAILMLTPAEAPTYEVKSVGRRISEDIFWVFS